MHQSTLWLFLKPPCCWYPQDIDIYSRVTFSMWTGFCLIAYIVSTEIINYKVLQRSSFALLCIPAESLAKLVQQNTDKLNLEGFNSWLQFCQSLKEVLDLDTDVHNTIKLHAICHSLKESLQAAAATSKRSSGKVCSPLWQSHYKSLMTRIRWMPPDLWLQLKLPVWTCLACSHATQVRSIASCWRFAPIVMQ